MIKKIIYPLLFVLFLVLLNACSNLIKQNETDVDDTEMPTAQNENQIILGKPRIIPDVPKDAIPPLDFPKYIKADEVDFLGGNDLIIGVNINDDTRAFPIIILNWHEIVNDKIGGKDVLVSYCPLCKSAILYDRILEGKLLSFGNTGALYESTLLMYDRETESSWAQIGGRAIEGELKGKRLKALPSTTTRWKDWKNLHPDTLVLSLDTGHRRNYESNPYETYDRKKEALPPFPISLIDKRLPPKELIVGVNFNDVKKAYPINQLGWKVINDKIGKEDIVIFTRPKLTSVFFAELDGEKLEFEFINKTIVDKNTGSEWNFLGQAVDGSLKGKKLTAAPSVYAFWFGWVAEYPNTLLFSEED